MKKWIVNILLVLFSLVFIISALYLLDYYLESSQRRDTFEYLSEIKVQSIQATETVSPDDIPTTPEGETVEPISELVSVTVPGTWEVVELLPEFSELYLMNTDLVGWITIADTEVDYPVLQQPNVKDYYLRRDFYGEYSSHGCIYVQENCDVFTPSDNLTIYGHRMRDGTMFNNLRFYEDKDYWEEHKYIQFNTLTERHTYEIFSVFIIDANVNSPFQYHLFVDAADEEHYNEFIDNCQSYALYDTGIVPTYGDKLITLSTCEYTHTNGRLVVVARRID